MAEITEHLGSRDFRRGDRNWNRRNGRQVLLGLSLVSSVRIEVDPLPLVHQSGGEGVAEEISIGRDRVELCSVRQGRPGHFKCLCGPVVVQCP